LIINDDDKLQSLLISRENLSLTTGKKGVAAVLVPLISINDEPHVVLTLRSKQLRHHGGEVAFPGGMWEEGDDYPIGTALRESEEEIGLPAERVKIMGGLNEMPTRRLQQVRPVVGIVDSHTSFVANESEIEAIFTVPLLFFKEDVRVRTDIFSQNIVPTDAFSNDTSITQQSHWVPVYDYQGYKVWGFTAAVIIQLMNRCFSANITRSNSAPEKIW